MKLWVIYAAVSALFAGLTAVLAKHGLQGISSELGLVVRTVFIFGMALVFGLFTVSREDVGKLTGNNYLWLAVSAAGTTLSWVFYYKALKEGDVSTVALIDKSSFVVAVVLGWVVLKEQFSWQVLAGAGLILAGVVVAGWKK